MASIFKNNFLSVAGQKERLTNMVNVLKIAANPLSKEKITATTDNKVVNKVVEAVANHPYVTAGVVAAGVTAVKNAPAIAGSLKAGVAGNAAKATASAVATNGVRNLAIAAGAGIVAGSLLTGGNKVTPTQNTSPNQTTTQNTNPPQDTSNKTTPEQNSNPSLSGDDVISGNNNSLRRNQNTYTYQDQYTTNTTYQVPTQTTTPQQTADQTTSPQQTATASGGTNWGVIAAVALAAYMLN